MANIDMTTLIKSKVTLDSVVSKKLNGAKLLPLITGLGSHSHCTLFPCLHRSFHITQCQLLGSDHNFSESFPVNQYTLCS